MLWKALPKNFSNTHLLKLRNEFAALYYEQETAYLNGLLRPHTPKPSSGHKLNPKLTSTGKPLGRPPADKSKFFFEYCVRSEKNIDVKVCHKGFCLINGFTLKCLQVLRPKIEQSAGEATIEVDRRGKHKNHPKVGKEVQKLIRIHIRSFPCRSSHYSSVDNPGRTLLSPTLSIACLYRLFLEKQLIH